VVKDLYELGRVKPIPERVRAKIVGQHPPGLTGLSTVDDQLVSIWAQTSSSLMWYRADLFEAKGWSVPTTAEGFDKLVATIAAEGTYAPFCAGIEAKGATGWYMTDWLENLLLTRRGADFYDRWATHQIPFNSPEVVEELRRMQGWLADPKFTYGSPDKVLATSVEEGFAGLADDPAHCAMAFNSQWVFATIQPAIDAGRVVVADPADGAPVSSKPTLSAFRLPPAVGQPPALVLGGDQLVALSDRPEVWQVMEYVASRDWGVPWAKMGGYISPHEDFDTAVYKDVPSKVIADAIHHTEVQRFDGTDGMPTEVGSGSVWTGMVDLLAGVDPQTVADAIEDSWRNVRQTGG
jgi:alpha-glucoside transport system substrate-binding protein